jgi:hypothetical protein
VQRSTINSPCARSRARVKLFPSRARKNIDAIFIHLYSASLKGGDTHMAKKKSSKKTTKKTTKKGKR